MDDDAVNSTEIGLYLNPIGDRWQAVIWSSILGCEVTAEGPSKLVALRLAQLERRAREARAYHYRALVAVLGAEEAQQTRERHELR